MTVYLEKFTFHVKIQHFVTAKSDQDPDTDPKRSGSKPMRIQNAGLGIAYSINTYEH